MNDVLETIGPEGIAWLGSEDVALMLRSCDRYGRAYGRFQWPLRAGEGVEPERWDPVPRCGNGLHGFLHGAGEGRLAIWSDDALWYVCGVRLDDCIEISPGGKCKSGGAWVVFVGDLESAARIIAESCPGSAVIGGTAREGDWGTAIAGYGGTAIAGYEGTAGVGDRGTAKAGDRGTAIAGDKGTAIAGNWGTARAGDWGTSRAGNWGTAIAGNWGTAIAGKGGTASAGKGGIVCVWWSRGLDSMGMDIGKRMAIGHVGEAGIIPHTSYEVRGGKLACARG